ncbi:MAG: hypothetical protein ACXWXT_19060, partial [Candidatus Binatia bacterium]
LVVKESLMRTNPAAVKEIFRLVRESKHVMSPEGTGIDPIQFGLANIRRSLELIVEYATQQGLIPIKFRVDDLFDDRTRNLL